METGRIRYVAWLTASCLLLSGCMTAQEDDEDAAQKPTEQSFVVTLNEPPAEATVGQNFTVSVTVSGSPQAHTDHLGAHYGPNSTDDPSTTAYPKTCVHQETDVPGTFEVTCKVDEAGIVYLRGHVRITTDDGTLNWWSDEVMITVAAA